MKKLLLLTMFMVLIFSTTAFAEEATPYLKNGTLEVQVSDSGSQVTENITLTNIEAFENGQVGHILTNFGEVSDLAFVSDGNNLEFVLEESETMNKVILTLPDGASGDFSYDITYSFASEGTRIPMVVPTVSSVGNGNVVLLKVNVPEGQYLHESFPIIDGGNTGPLVEYMMNIPNFVNLKIESSPPGFFTASTLYSLFGLLVILGIIAAWLVSERKAKLKAGGTVNV